MIELDKLAFKGEDIGDEDKCKEWVKRNPDIYTVLMQDDKVIGYINFMPIIDKHIIWLNKANLKIMN